MTSLIAVVLTLVGPCFFILIRALLFVAIKRCSSRSESATSAPSNNTTEPNEGGVPLRDLPAAHIEPSSGGWLILATMNQTNGPLEALKATAESRRRVRLEDPPGEFPTSIWATAKSVPYKIRSWFFEFWSDFMSAKLEFLFLSLVWAFCIAVFVGETAGGILSAGISTDSMALSESPHCGLWENTPSNNTSIYSSVLNSGYDRESRSAAYRDQCYGPDVRAEDCNLFYKQSINYTATSNTSCPFDGHACLEGGSASYTLDTGLLDSNVLGINARASNRYKFQRKMTCAPLVSDDRYIKYSTTADNRTQWEYFYGIGDYTWRTPYLPTDWAIGGYSMG